MLRSHAIKALLGLSAVAATAILFGNGGGASLLSDAAAQPTPDIRTTKHNFTSIPDGGDHQGKTVPSRSVKSTSTTEVCVYCHTPHAATTAPAPLWNRALPADGTYTMYSSASLDQSVGTNPGAYSKLCLSCHDGTLAVSTVANPPGPASTQPLATGGLSAEGKIEQGTGGGTNGYTRLLGTDLKNDHPIAVKINDTIAGVDGELREDAYDEATGVGENSSTGRRIFNKRSKGVSPPHLVGFADDPTAENSPVQVQCPTCHDPHLGTVTDGSLTNINNKFLRLNRFQLGASSKSLSGYGDATAENTFNPATDQVCLGCHTREGKAWTASAHANDVSGDVAYDAAAASLRQFPTQTKVWNAGCLNCHDTHTKTGAQRLLREGVNTTTPSAAVENTCFQCHGKGTAFTGAASSTAVAKVLGSATVNTGLNVAGVGRVPEIQTEFEKTYKMPLGKMATTALEVHTIQNANFEECRQTLGSSTAEMTGVTNSGALTKCGSVSVATDPNANRHAECTDCHNPHRVRRASTFYGESATSGEGAKRTHNVGGVNGNVISGALRGAWGVEPTSDFSGAWPKPPSAYRIVRGDPGDSSDTAKSNTYVTREYQVCFKCHSDYGSKGLTTTRGTKTYGVPDGTGPALSATRNGMTHYTNVAAEFSSVNAGDAPTSLTDQGEESNSGTACGGNCDPTPSNPAGANNHRSWHPVMFPTGRDRAERGSGSWNNLRYPYAVADTGKLTMHCSDCHGGESSWTQGSGLAASTGGPNANVQGPHGSTNPFILKGIWTDAVTPSNAASSNSGGSICGRCHDPANATSGFASGNASHGWEVKQSRYCMFCHVAVPHGWKNKAFLVNLNCVQAEGGASYGGADGSTCTATSGEKTIKPYYNRARLQIDSWAVSGGWTASNCNGSDWMSTACGI